MLPPKAAATAADARRRSFREPSESHPAGNISVADILAMKGTVIMILAYAPRGEPGRAPPYSINNGKAALCMPTPKAVKKGHYNCTTDIVSAVMGGGYYILNI